MRPIDADVLKEWFVAQIDHYKKYSGDNCNAMVSAYEAVLERIDNEPTMDAVPVRHGYNKQIKFPSLFECSVCGWESWDTYCGDTDTFNADFGAVQGMQASFHEGLRDAI